jgi:hypothetical protein
MPELATAHDTAVTNRLLKNELSALETYHQAFVAIGNSGGALELLRVQEDHIQAAEALLRFIARRGEIAEPASELWGIFARFTDGSVQMLGRGVTLRVLREGEEQVAKDYEGALNDRYLDPDLRRLIERDLLPPQRTHVLIIKSLIGYV